jgi:hypothetical protein
LIAPSPRVPRRVITVVDRFVERTTATQGSLRRLETVHL